METILLFFLKHYDKNVDLEAKVTEMIKNVFPNNINDQEFRISSSELNPDWKPRDIIIKYDVKKVDKMVMLMLSSEHKTVYQIVFVQRICNQIQKGEHRKDYYITVAYDESSQNLCQVLYPWVSSFEKKLRRLIYELFIKTDGEQWVSKTLDQIPSLSDEIKERMKNGKNATQDDLLIEGAIDEFDYSHYNHFINGTLIPKGFDSIWENDFKKTNLNNLNRDQIVDIIERYRPRTLWDIAFKDFDELIGFGEAIETIRNTRNKVMHSKWLSYDEYLQTKNTLRQWSGKLDSAFGRLEKQLYSKTQKQFFSEYYSSAVKAYYESIKQFLSVMNSSEYQSYINNIASLGSTVSEIMRNVTVPTFDASWLNTFLNKIALSRTLSDDPNELIEESSDDREDMNRLIEEGDSEKDSDANEESDSGSEDND